jgi:acyl-CoA thioester hydrolase
LLDEIGLDDPYRKATGFTIYTLGMQIRYLQEVKLGEPISTFCQILEHDSKRIRVWLSMQHTEQGTELATSEQLLLCFDQSGPKAANFPSEIAARLAAIGDAHATLPIPEDAGKGIRLKRV